MSLKDKLQNASQPSTQNNNKFLGIDLAPMDKVKLGDQRQSLDQISASLARVPGQEGYVIELNNVEKITGNWVFGEKIEKKSFLIENQTDRLALQQWTQDSMNRVLDSDKDMQTKLNALHSLTDLMYATESPFFDRLPNPDNVKPRSPEPKSMDSYETGLMLVETARRLRNGEKNLQMHFEGLERSSPKPAWSVKALENALNSKKER